MARKPQVEQTKIAERNIEYFALSELMTRLHPDNPKQHDLGALIVSYKEHGYVASGILDDRTGLFLAGHGRIQALDMMRKQGVGIPDGIRNGGDDWLVPVQVGYSSRNDIQAKAYIVADNKLTVLGGWDESALATLLQEVAGSAEVALEATGYDADDLDELLRDLGMADEPTPDPGAQIDRAAELQEKWQVMRGDVWQVGKHRIMCGDSTCAEDVEGLMGGVKADAVVTDPPYGINLDASYQNSQGNFDRGIKKSRGYSNVIGDNTEFDPTCYFDLFDGIREQFWFGADYYRSFLPDGGSWLVWDKRDGLPEFDFTLSEFELCWSRQPHKRKVYGVRWFGAFGTEKQDVKNRIHPTQKPIQLIVAILELADCHNVVDPFLGSGTTIVACEQTGRVGYGMEIAPEYVAVCLERLADMGLTPERITDNQPTETGR